MKHENAFSPIAIKAEEHDDINALSDAFSLNAFRYIDIAREARLNTIMARWPLLREISAAQEIDR